MKSCIRFAENISFSASTHKIYKPEDAKNLMFKNTFCMGFCPPQAENFETFVSPEMQFLQGFEGYLTSKSQKISPAAQEFDERIW